MFVAGGFTFSWVNIDKNKSAQINLFKSNFNKYGGIAGKSDLVGSVGVTVSKMDQFFPRYDY